MGKHTIADLAQMQSLPLSIKIQMTKRRLTEWIEYYGEDGVYVSFSGGKDSTVLLDLARQCEPGILAAFVDTGLEYPEIREFVKTFANVEWLKPKKTFKRVIEDYGYPFISKEVSAKVYGARRYMAALENHAPRLPYSSFVSDLYNVERRTDRENPDFVAIQNGTYIGSVAFQKVMGQSKKKDGSPSLYNISKYRFFLDAPFEISPRCCDIMKKSPAHGFTKQTGRKPITAQMASESWLRTQKWLLNGCNGFDMKVPISNPMSFWTDQDVLLYIKKYGGDMVQRRIDAIESEYGCPLEKILDERTGKPKFDRAKFTPMCSVYGGIEEVPGLTNKTAELAKKADLDWLYDEEEPALRTTGCDRTGCMFCGYGCHLEKPGEGRFLKMKETHPKQYDYIMRPADKGGLNYKEVIDWINEHGGFHIEY